MVSTSSISFVLRKSEEEFLAIVNLTLAASPNQVLSFAKSYTWHNASFNIWKHILRATNNSQTSPATDEIAGHVPFARSLFVLLLVASYKREPWSCATNNFGKCESVLRLKRQSHTLHSAALFTASRFLARSCPGVQVGPASRGSPELQIGMLVL